MKNKKILKEKGITLIALVITIIVLLILAGVSIAMLTGENGILTQAQNASIKTGRANVIEQGRADIMGKQTEEGSTNLIKTDIKEVLDKYFESVPDNFTLDTLLHTKEEYGDYDIKVSEIYNGTLAERSKTAEEVLKVNPEVTETKDKSPYVRYNGLNCRVLYNDEIHGIQIVTVEAVEEIGLGEVDENVEETDFEYNGTATIYDGFLKAAASYNNAVNTLNNKAKNYMDNKGLAVDARSLGSVATLAENNKFQEDTAGMFYGEEEYMMTYNWNGKLKNADNNYEEDINQINVLDLNVAPYMYTWLASREIREYDSSQRNFCVRVLSGGRRYT